MPNYMYLNLRKHVIANKIHNTETSLFTGAVHLRSLAYCCPFFQYQQSLFSSFPLTFKANDLFIHASPDYMCVKPFLRTETSCAKTTTQICRVSSFLYVTFAHISAWFPDLE